MRRLLIIAGVLACLGQVASAQGLIWSLPEEGAWVRYEGTYSQTVHRPDSAEGDVKLEWHRMLTIKSLQRQQAEYDGVAQPCRWIEIKSETGKSAEGVLDTGPGGIRMYKILVPERELRGTVNMPIPNNREMFAETIPVVEGWRRIGDEPAARMESGLFQLYPVVTLLRHFRELQETGRETLRTPAGDFGTTVWKGTMTMETPSSRSVTSTTLYRSPAIPFGLVKWTTQTVNETKVSTEARDQFRESEQVGEELQIVAIGNNAESEFLTQ